MWPPKRMLAPTHRTSPHHGVQSMVSTIWRNKRDLHTTIQFHDPQTRHNDRDVAARLDTTPRRLREYNQRRARKVAQEQQLYFRNPLPYKSHNTWNWLTAPVHDRHLAVDVYRAKHPPREAYTRYTSALLPCDTRIGLIHISTPLFATEAFKLKVAEISHHDTTSDHHPVYCHFQLPSTPEHLPHQMPSTLFRRLTQDEKQQFRLNLKPLNSYAQSYPPQVPPHLFVEDINTLCHKVSLAYHSITRPAQSHSDTQVQKQFKSILANLPSGGEPKKSALRKLQALSDSWRAKIIKKRKHKLQ